MFNTEFIVQTRCVRVHVCVSTCSIHTDVLQLVCACIGVRDGDIKRLFAASSAYVRCFSAELPLQPFTLSFHSLVGLSHVPPTLLLFFFFFMYFFVNPWWIQTCHSGVARALWKPAAPAGRATKEGNNFSVNKESHSHLKIAEPLTRQESFESGLDAPAANGLYSLHYTDIIDPCKK